MPRDFRRCHPLLLLLVLLTACEDSDQSTPQAPPRSQPPLLVVADPVVGVEPFRLDVLTGSVSLLLDTNTGTPGANAGPGAALGSTVLFGANDGIHGHELWRTDGAQTEQIAETCAGTCGEIRQVVADGTQAWIVAAGADGSDTLWISDGTMLGTRAVIAGEHEAGSYSLTVLGRSAAGMLIAEGHGDGGLAVLLTDGTASGTSAVTTLPSGYEFAPRTSPGTSRDGVVYFTFTYSVWRSDGTAGGTRQLPLSLPQENDPPVAPLRVNDTLFLAGATDFAASEGVSALPTRRAFSGSDRVLCNWQSGDSLDVEMWFDTGYPSDRRFIWASASGEPVFHVTATNTAASAEGCFFMTLPGTLRLAPADGGDAVVVQAFPAGQEFRRFHALGVAGGRAIVLAERSVYHGEPSGTRRDLWSLGSDGIVELGRVSSATPIARYGNQLLLAIDGEPWLTDGSIAHTRRVLDINRATTVNGWPYDAWAEGGLTFFAASTNDQDSRQEIFVSDGSTAGTVKVADNVAPGWFRNRVAGGVLNVLHAVDRTSIQLEILDLVSRSLTPLATACDDEMSVTSSQARLGDVALMAVAACGELYLWRSDGTPAGTARELLAHYPAFPAPATTVPTTEQFLAQFTLLRLFDTQQRRYLLACRFSDSCDLWRVDSTAAGSSLLAAFPKPDWQTTSGDSLYWSLDGVLSVIRDDESAPETPVGGLPPGNVVNSAIRLGGKDLFFTNGNAGSLLWASNSASAELLMNTGSFMAIDTFGSDNLAYFLLTRAHAEASPFAPKGELWRTDGTADGTWRIADRVMTRDLARDPATCQFWNLTLNYQNVHVALDEVWFLRHTPEAGVELWFSDGSRAEPRQMSHLAGTGCELLWIL